MFRRCRMVGTLFNHAIMHGTHLENNDMTNAVLDDASAIGAKFIRCNLTNASFKNTNLALAQFVNCTQNGVPVTKEWLVAKGAQNTDSTIVRNENVITPHCA